MTKQLFYCHSCKNKFAAKGKVKKWKSSLYGPCKKRVAICPVCKKEADEYAPPKKRKASLAYSSQSACTTGACPYVN